MDFDRGSVCLRYVVVIMEDVDYFLGKILYKDMKGIRFVYRKRYLIFVIFDRKIGLFWIWNKYMDFNF